MEMETNGLNVQVSEHKCRRLLKSDIVIKVNGNYKQIKAQEQNVKNTQENIKKVRG